MLRGFLHDCMPCTVQERCQKSKYYNVDPAALYRLAFDWLRLTIMSHKVTKSHKMKVCRWISTPNVAVTNMHGLTVVWYHIIYERLGFVWVWYLSEFIMDYQVFSSDVTKIDYKLSPMRYITYLDKCKDYMLSHIVLTLYIVYYYIYSILLYIVYIVL